MNAYFYISIASVFGLMIGSFLNVCIWRIPQGLSVNEPKRSFCPKCKNQLTWSENIPLLSWLIQSGKCKNCQEKISARYPFVELLTGIAAGGSAAMFGQSITALIIFLLTATLIVITFIDLDHKIIPNKISYPGMIIGLIFGVVSEYTNYFAFPLTQGILDSVAGFFLGGGIFYGIGLLYYAMTKKIGLGGGDIKLMAMLGAILGWKCVLPTVFTGSALGAVFGISLMLFNKSGRYTEIPFGPWLSFGALVYIFTDLQIFRLY